MAADAACIGALKVRAGRRRQRLAITDGRWAITCIGAEPEFSGFDRVVFAAGARAAADALPNTWAWTAARLLLRSVAYCGGRRLPGNRALGRVGATRRPRADLLRSCAGYVGIGGGGDAAAVREHFILSSWYPAVQSDGDDEGERPPVGIGCAAASISSARDVRYRHPERLRRGPGRRVRNGGTIRCSRRSTCSSRSSSASSRAAAAPPRGIDVDARQRPRPVALLGFAAAARHRRQYPFAADADTAADFARLRGSWACGRTHVIMRVELYARNRSHNGHARQTNDGSTLTARKERPPSVLSATCSPAVSCATDRLRLL